jgi:hypothetical protein
LQDFGGGYTKTCKTIDQICETKAIENGVKSTLLGLKLHFFSDHYLEDPHQYQLLSAKSKRLRAAGLSWVKIGKQLKVTDKTAKKGVLVVLFISVLPEVAAAEKDRSVRRFELMG